MAKPVFLPITSKEPPPSRLAIEIPEAEKRRAGLAWDARLWIMLDDINTDVPGKSYYIRSQQPLGRFSKAWFYRVVETLIAQRRSIRSTDRTN